MARSLTSSDLITFSTSFNFVAPFTIASWVNPATQAGPRAIIGSANGASQCIEFRIDGGTPATITLLRQNAAALCSSSATFSVGTWGHAAATHSGTAQQCYVNGSASGAAGTDNVALNATATYGVGYNEPYAGSLADLAVWNVVLSAGEIAALASGIRVYTVRYKSIIGYWPIDGLVSPEPDFSGSKFNGTLTGTAAATGPPITMFTPRWPLFMDIPPPPQLQLMGQIWM